MSQTSKRPVSHLFATLDRVYAPALVVLTMLAVLCTLYFAKDIIMPILLAGLLALFLSPIVRGLSRLKVPKLMGSALVLVTTLFATFYLMSMLVEPASNWLARVPLIGDKISAEINRPESPLSMITDKVIPAENSEDDSVQSVVDSTLMTVFGYMAESAANLLVQLAMIIVTTYFFLGFGEELLRNIVRAQETFTQKKVTVVMFESVRNDISYYVLVISLINACLGLATAGAMSLLGVEDALLWGALAFLLNFAPYVGPAILLGILGFVGFVEFDSLSEGLIVPGCFLLLNIVEGQFITPSLLGRRFNINPLLVVIWMFFWSWMWGAVGLLIAIPLLMSLKIMAKQLNFMGAWVIVLDGANVHESVNALSGQTEVDDEAASDDEDDHRAPVDPPVHQVAAEAIQVPAKSQPSQG